MLSKLIKFGHMNKKLEEYIKDKMDAIVFLIVVIGTILVILINPSNFVVPLLVVINLIFGLVDLVKKNKKIKLLISIILMIISFLIIDEINISSFFNLLKRHAIIIYIYALRRLLH